MTEEGRRRDLAVPGFRRLSGANVLYSLFHPR
jgi:hypothetical protein